MADREGILRIKRQAGGLQPGRLKIEDRTDIAALDRVANLVRGILAVKQDVNWILRKP